MSREVGFLYDQMGRFESFLMRVLKGKLSYPIHKKLKFQGHDKGETYNDINDWILDNIEIKDDARVLDAGCGVGKTLFEICRKRNITGLGVSLSENEIHTARKESVMLKAHGKCTFLVKNFNEAFHEKFDLIIAIESIKHTDNLQRTLKNLTASLNDNGQLIIVDDFQAGVIGDEGLKRTFMESWSLGTLYDLESFTHILDKEEGEVRFVRDFTGFVKMKDRRALLNGIKVLGLLKSLVLFPLLQKMCVVYKSGLILDYYYAQGLMEYKLICFQKGLH